MPKEPIVLIDPTKEQLGRSYTEATGFEMREEALQKTHDVIGMWASGLVNTYRGPEGKSTTIEWHLLFSQMKVMIYNS